MSLKLYQIIVLVIAVTMIAQSFIGYIKGQSGQTLYKVALRSIVWGGMAAVVIFPQITNVVARIVGLEGNINAVILTGFLLVFLMIFKLLSAIERLEQQITTLTRAKALKEFCDHNPDRPCA